MAPLNLLRSTFIVLRLPRGLGRSRVDRKRVYQEAKWIGRARTEKGTDRKETG